MDFQLYNTLHRKKEQFLPISESQVQFYSCGPTVYNTVHIGNLRAFLCADTLYRWLKYGLEYSVQWVMNITDVDDKTIRDSQVKYPNLDPMKALLTFTRHYEEKFFEDLETLNIPKSSFSSLPRATDSIIEMQDLITRIYNNGIAYEKDGSIYFSVEKYIEKQQYGKLVQLDLDKLKTGTRTLADEIEKDNAQDFVLWKAQKEGEPSWSFELDKNSYPGRPGWHIECSAMEYAAFGKLPFDIHSGGVDLCFPHHEDEIAQSTAGYGQAPTNYWIHNEHLLVEGQKMSKSLGNFYTLSDLMEKGYSAEVVRFFLVTNHYRTKLNLTEDGLQAAHESLQRIRNAALLMKKSPQKGDNIDSFDTKFRQALCDDINTPQAISVIFSLLSETNIDTQKALRFLEFAEHIFGVRFLPQESQIPPEIQKLAEERHQAKEQKDYEKADTLRDEAFEQGFVIRDTSTGFEILPREL